MLGYVVLVEDRFHRAYWNTSIALDAFVWVDVQHVGVLIEAVAWANSQAVLIFAPLTRFRYDHGHILSSSR